MSREICHVCNGSGEIEVDLDEGEDIITTWIKCSYCTDGYVEVEGKGGEEDGTEK